MGYKMKYWIIEDENLTNELWVGMNNNGEWNSKIILDHELRVLWRFYRCDW
jgi:hypothetical protein